MNKEEAKSYVTNKLAEKIRDKMRQYHPPMGYFESDNKLSIIKEIASLIDELLKNKDIKDKFNSLIKGSPVNGDHSELKLLTFNMIRNLVLHFPFFDKWDDIFINNNILEWDKPDNSSIKRYFQNNNGAHLKYDIYMKKFGKWENFHTVEFDIPILGDEDFFIKNMISEDDVIWTFCLIDSFLEYLGLDTEDYSNYSV